MSEIVDVAAIRAALSRATPGPWEISRDVDGYYFVNARDEGKWDTVIASRGVLYEGDDELIVILRNNADALLDAVEDSERRREGHAYGASLWAQQAQKMRERAEAAESALERAQAASEGVDMLVAAAERRGAVKALRDAAEVWYDEPGPKHPLSAVTWIYERATRIENGADL